MGVVALNVRSPPPIFAIFSALCATHVCMCFAEVCVPKFTSFVLMHNMKNEVHESPVTNKRLAVAEKDGFQDKKTRPPTRKHCRQCERTACRTARVALFYSPLLQTPPVRPVDHPYNGATSVDRGITTSSFLYITQHGMHGSSGESSSCSHETTWSCPLADASPKHRSLFQAQPSCLAHSRTVK